MGVHPKQMIKVSDDKCRAAHLRAGFEEVEDDYRKNVLMAGDFNIDPYRMDLHSLWHWENQSNIEFTKQFFMHLINNWDTPPTLYKRMNVPSCGIYEFNMWDFEMVLDSIDFVVRDSNGNDITSNLGTPVDEADDYYELDMIFDWSSFGFKICADDPGFPDLPQCVKIPMGVGWPISIGGGCGDCDHFNGTCDNYMDFNYSGTQIVTLKLTEPVGDNLTAPIVTEIDMSDMELDVYSSEFGGIILPAIIELFVNMGNLDQVVLDSMGETPVDILKWYIPIDYSRIVTGMSAQIPEGYQSSVELILQYTGHEDMNKPFTIHNQPHVNAYPEVSIELYSAKFTFDYILSNFASNGGCETFKFPFMDHHAVMCTLNPLDN